MSITERLIESKMKKIGPFKGQLLKENEETMKVTPPELIPDMLQGIVEFEGLTIHDNMTGHYMKCRIKIKGDEVYSSRWGYLKKDIDGGNWTWEDNPFNSGPDAKDLNTEYFEEAKECVLKNVFYNLEKFDLEVSFTRMGIGNPA